MTNAKYKKTVEDLSAGVFNLHTNLIALNEYLTRLSNANENLKSRNAELEMKQVIIETLQTDNDYLRNKIKCSEEIEQFLINELSKNELKIKALKNSSQLIKTYNDNHTVS